MSDDAPESEFFRSRRWQPGYDDPPHDDAPPHDGNGADREAPDDDGEVEAREMRDISQRLTSAAMLAHEPEPTREWIVDEIISADNLTLVSGEGGGGKTTVMLQLGAAMQTDGYWLNMRVKQGPALFVSSEDELKDLSISLRAILKIEGKSLAHCPNLHILSLADRDACMASAPSKLASLTATPLWRALEATVAQTETAGFVPRCAGRHVRRGGKLPSSRPQLYRDPEAAGVPSPDGRHPDCASVACGDQ